ncbi:hypothetical protein FXO37_05103 [Capsicum annuum]|nr:hypothetical protein FXO37_05103 [Capsicum annuum]
MSDASTSSVLECTRALVRTKRRSDFNNNNHILIMTSESTFSRPSRDTLSSSEVADGEVLAETVPSLQAQEKNDDTTNYIIETAVEDFESTEMDQQANKMFALQKIMMSKKFLVEAGYNLEFLSIDKFSIKKLYLKMLRGISESSMIKKYLQ